MRLRVGVVGGSIAGTATAALLARSHDVTVFERSSGLEDRGGGISLAFPSIEMMRELGLIDELPQLRPTGRTWSVKDGDRALGRVLARQGVSAAALHWGLLHRALMERIGTATVLPGVPVAHVRGDAHGAVLVTADGEEHAFDLVVGADGYRSLVRAQLLPELVPRDAGYALWRGILDESDVTDPDRMANEIHTVGTTAGHAMFYLVPGRAGETEPGRRRLNWAWYDLQAAAAAVAPGTMGAAQRRQLDERARDQLPPWFGAVIAATPSPSVQELTDLAPDRYADGRVCLVGDAASIARPHTAASTLKALEDAAALARALDVEATVDEALCAYSRERSAAGERLVELGRTLGRQQVVDAPDWSTLDEAGFDEWFRTGRTSATWFAAAAAGDRRPTDPTGDGGGPHDAPR